MMRFVIVLINEYMNMNVNIQSRMASSESHNTRRSSVSSIKHTLSWIGHVKVILIAAGRNPERCVIVTCN